jgi:hypothetical protein
MHARYWCYYGQLVWTHAFANGFPIVAPEPGDLRLWTGGSLGPEAG